MEKEQDSLQREFKTIQNLFFNKQLDEFVQKVQKIILPYVQGFNHHHTQGQMEKKTQNKVITKQQIKTQKKEVKQQKKQEKKHYKQSQQETDKLQPKQQQIFFFNQSQKCEIPQSKCENQKKQIETAKQYNQQELKKKRIEQLLKNSKILILQKYEEVKLVLFKLERQMTNINLPIIQKSEWKINKINETSKLGVKTKGTMIQLRYQGLVQTNISNLCIMIYMTQLYNQWVPFCTGSKTVNDPSPLEKVVLLDFKIPFLTERYAYFHGLAIDRINKNGKIYVYAEGISHQKQLLLKIHKAPKQEYQKKVAKSVVLDAKYFICEIGNEGNGKYMFKCYGVLDSHMPLLPQKVVNYIVKQMGGMIFDKIVKKANNFKGTPWQKQLKENQKRPVKNKFYDWLQQRISNWQKESSVINKQSKI